MKLLHFLILFILLPGIQHTFAQDSLQAQKCLDYDVRFKKLKELHLAHFFSESNARYRQLEKEFLKKLNGNFERVPDDVLHYIIENVEKTSFGSYEAAEMEWAALKEAQKAAGMGMEKGAGPSPYVTYLVECVQACGTQIVSDVLKEIQPKMMEELLKK